jgi:hypothetical protein
MKKRAILILSFLLANAITLFADGPPLPGCDDPDDCPIDSWVVAFAICALTITILHLYNKRKTAPQLSDN